MLFILCHLVSIGNETKYVMKSRPTIADLATASGVSLSTVNRILAGSGSVRAETIRRVQDAAQEIGFYGQGVIEDRRRRALPSHRLGFLLQQSHRPLYQLWAEAIRTSAAGRTDAAVEAIVQFEDDLSPEAVAANLLRLGGKVDVVAVVTADHPLVSQAIDELRTNGVPVVAYITDLSAASRAGFVGTDSWKVGRTAAWFLSQMSDGAGTFAPFIGSHRYQSQDIADASFRSYMREHAPDLQILETLLTHEEPENAYAMVRRLLAEQADLKGIFVNGGGISGVLRALRELPPERRRGFRIICLDIGPETRKGLGEGLITAALRQPVERMPEELISVMLRLAENPSSASIEQRIVPFEIVTPESLWT